MLRALFYTIAEQQQIGGGKSLMSEERDSGVILLSQ
jgi:hypothetical protein